MSGEHTDTGDHCTCGHPGPHPPGGIPPERIAEFFRIMGDDTRLRILLELEDGELCVNCIAERLGCTVSAVSHQLRVLRDARLVTSRREGRSIHYSLCDDHVKTIIDTAVEHLLE